MKQMQQLLKKYFGYDRFLKGQKEIIETITDKEKHCLVMMPTGSGKSLCYQLPAMALPGGTLIISPLIALMKDQTDALRSRGLPAGYINSTVNAKAKRERLAAFVRGDLKMLYVTPERFRKQEFLDEIRKANISLLAIDEAHCISEWGHDFRPDYSRIAEFRNMLNNPLTIALTATATPEVRQDIITSAGLKPDNTEVFNFGIDRPNLRLELRPCYGQVEKLEALLNIFNSYPGSGIVYFSLIKTLNEFSEMLDRKKIPHNIYHGKLPARERKEMQERFIGGSDEIVLATNAFGMGIDKPDIRFVAHAELPGSLESYYQEIGRAGRDGKPSLCCMLWDENDVNIQMDFAKWSNPDANFYARLFSMLEEELEQVNAMGMEYLKEQLVFKNRTDFRLETALGMLDRFGAIERNQHGRISLTGEYPELLFDQEFLEDKRKNDLGRLLNMVRYCNTETCRARHIADYFGTTGKQDCGNCDICNI